MPRLTGARILADALNLHEVSHGLFVPTIRSATAPPAWPGENQ